MRATFHLKTLAVAIATLSVASMTNAAGLDRSGQDVTAFLQDGTYAEAVYTYIDADVTGVDNDGNKSGDIAESYDFFRYGVKTDLNDKFSVGVLYDEPFGAAAKYSGDNNFTGVADITGAGAIQQVANRAIENTQEKIAQVEALQAADNPNAGAIDSLVYQTALQGLNSTLERYQNLAQQPSLDEYNNIINSTNETLASTEATLDAIGSFLSEEALQNARDLLAANQGDAQAAEAARDAVQNLLSIDEATNVEVRSNTLTLIGGMKFGAENQFQVYGGPVAQRLQADVKLRGNAYKGAAGYTAHSAPNQDYGWLAGVSYSKPEIALKAALTYRSEIDHSIDMYEDFPALAIQGQSRTGVSNFEVTTPKSVNFDFQTGVNPTTLATAKIRWVPWSDFSISPTKYTQASKLPLVDYSDDQWQVELGLGKRIAPKFAVSGSIGWDSGAGDPTTSLGPIEGYYSVGLGAKYDVTENWAVSAGGKYLWFGDAEGALPDRSIVSNFEDNDGFILGAKLSYQAK
ncbi:hypothetical protein ACTXMT_08345 [Psychrobacter faecalis]|jgi:long-chain fatty acid transport protein|uniref:hypothetical protein n=1 Tax=Psychrobacter TaxID=497 RepID=UPI00248B24F7|nr:hypothetical protein [Psychrobacter sp. WB2]WGV13723.1 hypothetical protein QJS82_03325 [Psychrobacter sp. WB2]